MNDFDNICVEFSELSREEYNTYSHAAGFFEGLAKQMFRDLSPKDQARYTREMTGAVAYLAAKSAV
jgi:hypothetical protein